MKSKLVFDSLGLTITDDTLYSAVSYKQNINSETDFCIGTVASAEVTFEVNDTSLSRGVTFTYYTQQLTDSTWRKVGLFTITDIKKNKNRYKITAYDLINRLNGDVTSLLSAMTSAVTLKALCQSICGNFELTFATSSFTNSNYTLIPSTVSYQNATGRSVLHYIAELAGCYVKADADGDIVFESYEVTETTLSEANYKSLELSDIACQRIDSVWIGKEDGDVGGRYPSSGSNTLKIYNNPFAYRFSQTQLNNIASGIYTKLYAMGAYYSGKIDLFTDYNIECGDIITNLSGTKRFLVMSKEWKDSGVTLSCSGNSVRESILKPAEMIEATVGKYNVLKRTTDGLVSEVGTLEGDVSTIQQQVGEISAEVATKADAEGGSAQSFGWSLTPTGFTLSSNGDTVMNVNSSGLEVNGRIISDAGYIGGIAINNSGLTVISGSDVLFAVNSDGKLHPTLFNEDAYLTAKATEIASWVQSSSYTTYRQFIGQDGLFTNSYDWGSRDYQGRYRVTSDELARLAYGTFQLTHGATQIWAGVKSINRGGSVTINKGEHGIDTIDAVIMTEKGHSGSQNNWGADWDYSTGVVTCYDTSSTGSSKNYSILIIGHKNIESIG